MRFPVNPALPLAALILTGAGGAFTASSANPRNTGPAGDYPIVVGEPFTIGSTVWTPVDQLNYDAVGLAIVGNGAGVSAAHKTLPLPSYVEVTSLESGRTILVRVERRGPMTNDALIELSQDAALQLGLSEGAEPHSRQGVRVRRVNPVEPERALLRQGSRAPERMETPPGLLKVLNRKLAEQSPLMRAPSLGQTADQPAMGEAKPTATPVVAKPSASTPPSQSPTKMAPALPNAFPKPSNDVAFDNREELRSTSPVAATPAPVATPKAALAAPPVSPIRKPATELAPAARPAQAGNIFVQVAAFGVEASARRVAAQLGGSVSPAGKFWRVRLGGFANRAQALAALEKAKAAGYSDSRILNAD